MIGVVETITVEPMSTVIDALMALASEVINEHTNDDGRCAVCGCAFPCPQAVLAEHNLAL